MFELERQKAKILHINVREEKDGDQDVLACDVKVEAEVGNDFLSQLAPTLKWSLYERAQQEELIEDINFLPSPRYPQLKAPLKWHGEIVGGVCTFHSPLDAARDLQLVGVVADLRLWLNEGGSMTILFRITFRPHSAEVGQISAMLGQFVDLSITPPELEVEG